VLTIVKEAVTVTDGSDEMEFDIDALPPKTCRKLEQYVKNCQANAKRVKPPKKQAPANINDIINS
jgi:hypothetical protein